MIFLTLLVSLGLVLAGNNSPSSRHEGVNEIRLAEELSSNYAAYFQHQVELAHQRANDAQNQNDSFDPINQSFHPRQTKRQKIDNICKILTMDINIFDPIILKLINQVLADADFLGIADISLLDPLLEASDLIDLYSNTDFNCTVHSPTSWSDLPNFFRKLGVSAGFSRKLSNMVKAVRKIINRLVALEKGNFGDLSDLAEQIKREISIPRTDRIIFDYYERLFTTELENLSENEQWDKKNMLTEMEDFCQEMHATGKQIKAMRNMTYEQFLNASDYHASNYNDVVEMLDDFLPEIGIRSRDLFDHSRTMNDTISQIQKALKFLKNKNKDFLTLRTYLEDLKLVLSQLSKPGRCRMLSVDLYNAKAEIMRRIHRQRGQSVDNEIWDPFGHGPYPDYSNVIEFTRQFIILNGDMFYHFCNGDDDCLDILYRQMDQVKNFVLSLQIAAEGISVGKRLMRDLPETLQDQNKLAKIATEFIDLTTKMIFCADDIYCDKLVSKINQYL